MSIKEIKEGKVAKVSKVAKGIKFTEAEVDAIKSTPLEPKAVKMTSSKVDSAALMSSISMLSTANQMLKFENEILSNESARKSTFIDKFTKLFVELKEDWNKVPKWQRLFVAINYIGRFISLMSEALNTDLDKK